MACINIGRNNQGMKGSRTGVWDQGAEVADVGVVGQE